MLYSVELRSRFSEGKDRNLLYSTTSQKEFDIIFMEQFTTYILYSKSLDAFYIGYTGDDISIRLTKHLCEHKGYTARAKDWEIAFTEKFNTKKEAIFREKELKSWKSKLRIKQFIDRGKTE